MNRYEKCYAELDTRNEAAFIPFTVLGDPDQETSLSILKTMVQAGADALELGLPFSDPLADGPTIQDAMNRALAANITPQDCLDSIKKFRETNATIPIGLLVYANLVHSFGLDEFYSACADAGIDSVLVADVPVRESQSFAKIAEQHGVAPVLLCPPNIDDESLQQVAAHGRGYTYLLSRAGVTGANVAAGMPVEHLLQELDRLNAPRPMLGFGISKPEHVTNAISAGAKGVIVGSAIVKIIQQNLSSVVDLRQNLADYIQTMKSATKRP